MRAAYAGLGQGTIVSVSVVGRQVVDVEADGERLLSNGSEDGFGVFGDEVADAKKERLGVERAGSGKERF